MRFSLLDRITQIEPGSQITAIKNVSLAEEYLADHFPKFPVLPGVMMLEASTQAAAWLIRATEDFAHSIVVLKQTKRITFPEFLSPGETLTVKATVKQHVDRETTVQIQGTVGEKTCVKGSLVLERYNLADMNPNEAETDRLVVAELRKLFNLLWPQPASRTADAR